MKTRKYRRARQSIKQQDFQSAVSVLLNYYDKIYENGLNNSTCEILGELILTGNNTDNHAKQVLDFYYSTAH